MNTPEFDSFINHFTSCANCHPRHDIYCAMGREMWIDDKAAFVASLDTLKERQYWLADMQKYWPQYIQQIKQKVLRVFEVKK